MDLSGFDKPGFGGNIGQPAPHVIRQPQRKAPSGLAGFLINNLPSIAGGVGLVGGEILDPFGGGLLTGSLASGAGEALKQKLLGQSLSPKQIAIQAGETAALGGIGKGFSAAKAGSKAILGTAPVAEDITGGVIKPTLRNNLATQGEQMQARGLGLSGGAKVTGSAELMPQDTERMLNTLKDQGIKIGNPNSVARNVQSRLDNLSSQINTSLETANKPLSVAARKGIAQNYIAQIEKLPGVDNSIRESAANLANNLVKNVNDTKSLVGFRRGLDKDVISYIANPDAATASKQQAAKLLRNVLKDQTNKLAPAVKPANEAYHALSEIKPFLGKGMREVNQPSGGLIGRVASSGPVQKVEQVLGKGIQSFGTPLTAPTQAKIAPSISPALSGVKNNLLGRTVAPILASPRETATSIAKQAVGRAVGGRIINGSGNNQPQDLSTALAQAGMPTDTSQTPQSDTSQSPYPLENALYDISRDPKNAATYEALYKFSNPTDNSQALDATQQKEISASQAAIGRIQQYGQQLESASGGNVATGSLATLSGKYNPLASAADKNAAALQSSRRDVAIQLATALMGGNKPSAQSVDEIEASLPSVNDSPQLRQAKLTAILTGLHENLRNYATPISQITSGLGYGNTTNGDVGSQLNSVLAGLSQ